MQAARPAGAASAEQAGGQSRPSAAGLPASASDDLAEVKKQVAMLERELADSERTHQLRSAACWFGFCLPNLPLVLSSDCRRVLLLMCLKVNSELI